MHLKKVFKSIMDHTGKTVFDIFLDITDKDTQLIRIKEFVRKLSLLDPTVNMDHLYGIC